MYLSILSIVHFISFSLPETMSFEKFKLLKEWYIRSLSLLLNLRFVQYEKREDTNREKLNVERIQLDVNLTNTYYYWISFLTHSYILFFFSLLFSYSKKVSFYKKIMKIWFKLKLSELISLMLWIVQNLHFSSTYIKSNTLVTYLKIYATNKIFIRWRGRSIEFVLLLVTSTILVLQFKKTVRIAISLVVKKFFLIFKNNANKRSSTINLSTNLCGALWCIFWRKIWWW